MRGSRGTQCAASAHAARFHSEGKRARARARAQEDFYYIIVPRVTSSTFQDKADAVARRRRRSHRAFPTFLHATSSFDAISRIRPFSRGCSSPRMANGDSRFIGFVAPLSLFSALFRQRHAADDNSRAHDYYCGRRPVVSLAVSRAVITVISIIIIIIIITHIINHQFGIMRSTPRRCIMALQWPRARTSASTRARYRIAVFLSRACNYRFRARLATRRI